MIFRSLRRRPSIKIPSLYPPAAGNRQQACKIKLMATTNKIALVTGGSRGLGKNMALSLAQKGIDVVTHAAEHGDRAGLEAWGLALPALPGFSWWELAAGASSSVAAHALIAPPPTRAPAPPRRSPSTPPTTRRSGR